MFFSLLIPVYNAEDYLDSCIDSIVKQTETDYEIVLVDDGSKDNSLSVCYKWRDNHPHKIRVISKDNTGSLDTRRVCLKEAKGEYLYFIDADDQIIGANALKELRASIIDTSCDMVIFNATKDLTKRKRLYKYPFEDNTIYENEKLSTIYQVLLSGTQLNTLWNKVFSRSIVDWNEDYTHVEDIIKGTDFYQVLPLISNAKRVLYLDRIYYYYNIQNGGGISHKFNPKLYKTTCIQHERLVKFSQGWILDDIDKKQLLKERFMSDVAQIILMIHFAKDIYRDDIIHFFSKIRGDRMYLENHTYENLGFRKKRALYYLDKEKYDLLLLHIKLCGLYRSLHEVLLKKLI